MKTGNMYYCDFCRGCFPPNDIYQFSDKKGDFDTCYYCALQRGYPVESISVWIFPDKNSQPAEVNGR